MNRDEFLDLGTHCSDKYCHQLDFLPFKCPSCALPFCQDHWRQENHNCDKWDKVKADNRIPSCPLCSAPIPHPPSQDPNIAMDQHLSSACPILNPSLPSKPRDTNLCNHKRCPTKLTLVKIKCDKCKGDFCAKHRGEKDHLCTGVVKTLPPTTSRGKGTGGMSGLAVLRRAQAATAKRIGDGLKGKGTKDDPIVIDSDSDSPTPPKSSSSSAKPPPQKSSSGLSHLIPNKTDKRAEAERVSSRKALELRAKKGLLTEDEKLKYATAKAMEAKSRTGVEKDSCTLS